jgi:hypothetical protein
LAAVLVVANAVAEDRAVEAKECAAETGRVAKK